MIIENSFGLKKIPIYLDSKFGKLNSNDMNKDPIVMIFKSLINFDGKSSFKE
jgi:hypothetical protein